MDNTLSAGKMYCDRRLCGVEKWYLEPPDDAFMRIPTAVLKCVFFLCLKEKAGRETQHFIGTAFFASVNSEAFPEQYAFPYIITARHNITDAIAEIERYPKKYHPKLFARINVEEGDARTIELPDDWRTPANQAVDVAVMSGMWLDETLEVTNLPLACSATEEKLRHHGIGIGSEVFVPGMFALRKGANRNLPIVRQGIIASMTDEQFRDRHTGARYDAYLIEALSTKGMSGSPVLVASNRAYVAGENPPCRLLLLGLMKGHFRDELEGYPKDKGDDYHAGLSTVVPVQEILKLVYGEKLMKEREEADLELIKQRSPVDDSALPKEDGPLTKEGFEEALRRASRKLPPDEEKDE